MRCRDGFEGAPEPAPFDRIVATVGCSDLSPRWSEQLAPSGCMLIPLRHASFNPLVRVLLGEVAPRLPDLTQLVVEDKEYAVEIHLPFLQRCLGHFRLVPIFFERQNSACVAAVAHALVSLLAVAGDGERTLLVASSDLSHDHDSAAAGRLDHTFLDLVAVLDAEGLLAAVKSRTTEACGAGAVGAAILAARGLGARECRVLHYATSGDVTGNHA